MKRLISVFLIVALSGWLLNASAAEPFRVAAKGAVLIDADSGRVLFAQNADQRLPMASTTKVMTTLLALENASLDEMVTVGKNRQVSNLDFLVCTITGFILLRRKAFNLNLNKTEIRN